MLKVKTIDLLSMIHKGNTAKQTGERVKGKLAGYRYFGFISEVIEEANLQNYLKRLSKVTPTDIWVSMEIMAVGDVREIAKSNENTHFAYGNIAVLAPKNTVIGDWYEVDGLARTVLYDGTGDCCYISEMKKVDGTWCVLPCTLRDLELGEVSDIIRQHIENSVQACIFLQPEIPEGYEYVRSYKIPYAKGLPKVIKRGTPTQLGIEIIDRSEEISFEEDLFSDNYVEVDPREAERERQEQERKQRELEAQKRQMAEEEKRRREEYERATRERETRAKNNDDVGVFTLVNGPKLSDNIDWSKVKYRPRVRYKPVTRLSVVDKPKRLEVLNEVLDVLEGVRDETLHREVSKKYELLNSSIIEKDSQIYKSLVEKLLKNSMMKPFGVAFTGSAVLKSFIESQEASTKVINECEVGTTLLMLGAVEIYKYMLSKASLGSRYKLSIPMTEEMTDAVNEIITGNVQVDFAGLYAVLVGENVSEMKKTALICNTLGISFIQIILNNPYVLLLVNSNLKFLTLETLANAQGVHTKEEDWRLACILNDFLVSQRGNTAYDVSKMYKEKLSMSVGVYGLKRLREESSLITRVAKANLKAYINPELNDSMWNYTSDSFNKYGKMIFDVNELKRALKAYIDIGLGMIYEGILYSTKYLKMELQMVDKLYSMAYKRAEYDESKIDDIISKFEKMKAKELNIPSYKLEKEQREAVHMVVYNVGCLTGPAGSGKTTSTEVMIYALKELRRCSGNTKTSVQYAAPTGKAAKRLQEIVGGNVRTAASLFGVGFDEKADLAYADDDDEFFSKVQADVFIFDEQAMTDTVLMYNMIMKVPMESQIFLLGDIDQLVPIKSGKPFLDFTRFLPTVALRVSKRSAEGSQISKNMKIITEFSENDNFLQTENGRDFKKLSVDDDSIVDTVVAICEHHIGVKKLPESMALEIVDTLPEKDIQVVCPVVSDRFKWNTDAINERLQDLFNPMTYRENSAISFKAGSKIRTLRVGSRVINITNDYCYRHFSTYENGVFTVTNNASAMNGDVGYIVGIFDGELCKLETPEGLKVESVVNGHELKKPERFFKRGYVIIAVEFYNADTQSNYYILYHGSKAVNSSTACETVLGSTDATCLQLAYALTTHKMQGSENKLIIFACGSGLNTEFLNRNHVYTAESRARLGLYEVGDTNAIEYARHFEGTSAITTTIGYAYE